MSLVSPYADRLWEVALALHTEPEAGVYLGSSDIGNVSAVTPAIHPFVAIADPDRSDHTPEFAATHALAATTIDLLTDAGLRTATRAEFTPSEGPARRSGNARSTPPGRTGVTAAAIALSRHGAG